jgi:site-specific recombinase XerD
MNSRLTHFGGLHEMRRLHLVQRTLGLRQITTTEIYTRVLDDRLWRVELT